MNGVLRMRALIGQVMIEDIVGSMDTFCPKMNQISRQKNSPSHLNESTIFPFCNPILVGGASNSQLPLSAQFLAVALELKRDEFTPDQSSIFEFEWKIQFQLALEIA